MDHLDEVDWFNDIWGQVVEYENRVMRNWVCQYCNFKGKPKIYNYYDHIDEFGSIFETAFECPRCGIES